VTGYRVYRNDQFAGETSGTDFTDGGLTPETPYSYAVTAVDSAGNASDPSGSVAATTGPAPTCSVESASSLIIGDNKVEWDLTNLESDALIIDRIEVAWPTEQGNLKRIKLDGAEIYSQQLPPPNAVIDSGWSSSLDRREISAGETERLKIEFRVKYKGDVQSDYAISVYFAEGCIVQF